jgi:sarcosine oxidase
VDVVVVGAGLVGSATAWHLARTGHAVTVLERGEPADRGGSSHGSARIFRFTYDDPLYAGLVARARPVWAELETAHGTQLITPTDSLDFGRNRAVPRLAAVLAEVGVDHEIVPASVAEERWPGLAFDSDVLSHAGAGVIDAERAVHAMLDLAQQDGARVISGWEVSSVEARAGGYRVHGHGGATVDAERVVVTAGGWLPALLDSLGLPPGFVEAMPPLKVQQEQAFHFPYRATPTEPARAWPTYVHDTGDILTYCLPGGRDAAFRGQKLAEFGAGRVLGTGADQDRVVDPDNRARMVAYARTTLPGLVDEPYAETTCLFTSTPTEDFVLDRSEGITVVSSCSGHGAKFAPLMGQLVAGLAAAPSADEGRSLVPERFALT